MFMDYVSAKEAMLIYKVSQDTLRRWANSDKIAFITTKGGHRRYAKPIDQKKKNSRQKIIYARVSSKKQESDLKRQIDFLKQKFPKHTVISDIASGVNFTRKGFNSILEQVFAGNVKQVVVSSHDRLSRFGVDLIENIFKHFDTKLVVENSSTEIKSPQEELAEDLLSIVTVFTAKYHGARKYIKKNKSGEKN